MHIQRKNMRKKYFLEQIWETPLFEIFSRDFLSFAVFLLFAIDSRRSNFFAIFFIKTVFNGTLLFID